MVGGGGAVLPNVSVCDDDAADTVHYSLKWTLDDIHLSPYIHQTTQPNPNSTTGVQYKPISQIISELSDVGTVIPEGYSIVGLCVYTTTYPKVSLLSSGQKWHTILNIKYLDNGEAEYIDANTFGQEDLPTNWITGSSASTYISNNYPSNYEGRNAEKYIFDGSQMFGTEFAHSCFAIKTNRPYIINGFTPDESNHEREAGFLGLTKEQKMGGTLPTPFFNFAHSVALIYGKWVHNC